MGSAPKLSFPTMICVPLMCQSIHQTVTEMGVAKEQGADLVEIRLDYIKDLSLPEDLETLLTSKPLPVIISHRMKCEGDDDKQLDALRLAIELRADYVEIELKMASNVLVGETFQKSSNTKLIISSHLGGDNSSKEGLRHLITHMESTGADIIKIVTEADDITHVDHIFNLLPDSKLPIIAYSTGDRGLISQLLCPKFGGFMVHASIGNKFIPGLPTLDSLKEVYKPENINAETKIHGLISNPVSHSKGPILHNPSFRHVGHNGIYVPMRVDDLREFFKVYSSPDFASFSVGIPHKEAVTGCCDEIHPLAKEIGAVNTIIRRPSDGKLVGYNTDCEAAISSIEDALRANRRKEDPSFSFPLKGKQFVLVGAGGAGRALAFGAKTRGARIVISDIDHERAKSLARSVSGEVWPFEDLTKFHPEERAILANATPLGMHPNTDRIPVASDTLGVYELVFDAVYTPRKTTLLKEAESAGAIVVSGVEMFLRQAVAQFILFTGGEAPVDFMREIIFNNF